MKLTRLLLACLILCIGWPFYQFSKLLHMLATKLAGRDYWWHNHG